MTNRPVFTTHFNRTIHTLDGHGFIRDWLISPAWIQPANDLDALLKAHGDPFGKDGRWVLTNGPDIAPLKEKIYQRRPFHSVQKISDIVEFGPMTWIAPGGRKTDQGDWKRIHTGDDGYVDWSHFSYTPEYRHSLMATQIEVDQPEWRTISIESQGPVQVWINGELLLTAEKFGYMQPLKHEIRTLLPSGISTLVISQWQISLREVRHAVRVRVIGLPVRVVIPSPGADEYASVIAERELNSLSTERWARETDEVIFRGSPNLRIRVKERGKPGAGLPITLKKGVGKVKVEDLRSEARNSAKKSDGSIDGDVTATMLDTGEIFLEVKVDSENCPVTRVFRSARVPERVRTTVPKSSPSVWRREVLEHVASNYASSARALARLNLDPSYVVTEEDLKSALTMITSRADCADFEAVGLVHILHRFPESQWESGLREQTKKALLDFKYWIDQPGLDAMCYFTENHQFVWHTAEHLIGDFFKKEKFSNANMSGAEHSRHGHDMALEWLVRKLEGGFSEYDSNAYLAIDTLALVSMLEFSPSLEIRKYSEALLDRLLFSLASNSWRGIHGAAHGRSYTTTLRSSRFEETAPIMWAMWGMGALNSAVLPVTTLITSTRYELPPMIRKVAQSLDKTWSARQCYRGKYRFTSDLLERPYSSDLKVWRTSYGMLSSVQDYRSGLPGLQEHVWGFTLSTEVQVLATYPAASSHASSVRPNAWAGHLVLPRVRQENNVVLSIFPQLVDFVPEKSHLWFPTPWMDDYLVDDVWIAGQVGKAFIAVATPGGFLDIPSGDTAKQEWIPRGRGQLYVAVLEERRGSRNLKAFLKSLKRPSFDDDAMAIDWKYGKRYQLEWDKPFLINQESTDIDAGIPEVPPRLENPAVTVGALDSVLNARFNGERLTIDITQGLRIAPTSRAE
jgi:hypothetical protein